MKKISLILIILSSIAFAKPYNAPVQKYINSLKIQAKKSNQNFIDFSMKRGEKIFTSYHIGKHGKKIACASCHTKDLRAKGKHVRTGKIIKPLSPFANRRRLTRVKNVKKWLRRNFNDVYKRVGTPLEKGDVLYYINSK